APVVVGEPQLGHEPGEADEEGRVEDALPAEESVASAAHPAEAELDDEDARVRGDTAGRRLPVDPRGGAVADDDLAPHVLGGLADLAATQHARRPQGAPSDGAPRDGSWQR